MLTNALLSLNLVFKVRLIVGMGLPAALRGGLLPDRPPTRGLCWEHLAIRVQHLQ